MKSHPKMIFYFPILSDPAQQHKAIVDKNNCSLRGRRLAKLPKINRDNQERLRVKKKSANLLQNRLKI